MQIRDAYDRRGPTTTGAGRRIRRIHQAVFAQYAEDMVANATMSRDEAEGKAERDNAALLPDGFATRGHTFYFIEDADLGTPIGRLWFAVTGSAAYLYEIFLEPFARSLYQSIGYAEVAVRMRKQL